MESIRFTLEEKMAFKKAFAPAGATDDQWNQHLNGTQFFDRVALQIYGDDAFILETIAEGLTLEVLATR
jgi:hypothetical protein